MEPINNYHTIKHKTSGKDKYSHGPNKEDEEEHINDNPIIKHKADTDSCRNVREDEDEGQINDHAIIKQILKDDEKSTDQIRKKTRNKLTINLS